MKSTLKIFLKTLAATAAIFVTTQAQAITLTFEDGVAGSSAETFYSSLGVTFSGGGLLADGADGGMAGQPIFGGGRIGTFNKDSSGAYSDSFFDIWIHFGHDVYDVSGDYFGNLGYGGAVTAYDASGNVLDSMSFSALTGSTTDVGMLASFGFSSTSAIAEIHMISDGATAATMLDNLSFAPVPVPAAVWLFGSGLIGLVGFARQKS
ncbi:MAG: VPLPA-CTERM sorting domain-containing protein [Gammaproteobacteria bacterium]|nr:VPLPA-CTERM sorting domain-containing protein [Gammaproteobacteria bacterium]